MRYLALRVAKTYTVNKGDLVWYGKYKNQRGEVKNFGMSDKGDPTITVEQLPSPSARKPKKKSPKTLNLFKIRPRKEDEHDKARKEAVSKALSKKDVPKADGSGTTTVYEYGPRQVAQRNKEKAVRIEALRKKMADLRQKARGDLSATDPQARLTALAVCLMDETYARVGNEKSAKDGHHGVTNWTVGHVVLGPKSATVKYTGKSGVKQEKVITNTRVLAALRKALKGKGKGDKVLCDGDECDILAKDVNAYLKPFEITAKDIRGLHANEEMKHHLKEQRKAGPELPRARKERDKILKAEFKAALDLAAKAVGHEGSTLRSQYLVPSMEASYTHDGTVLDRLDKTAGGNRTLYHLAKKPAQPKPKRVNHWADRGQPEPDWVRPWLDAPVQKAVFLTPNPAGVWQHHGVVGDHVYAYEVPEWVIKEAGGLNRHDRATEIIIPDVLWKHVRFRGKSKKHQRFKEDVRETYSERAMGQIDRNRALREKREGVVYQAPRRSLATLSDAEKEDRESERLVRQSPKFKPPRKDKERGRIKDTDPDTDPDEAQDQKDQSNNYKDAAARVALRYLVAAATATKPVPVPASTPEREERQVGDTWKDGNGKWSAKGKDGIQSGFASDEAAKAWLKGGPKPGADPAPAPEGGSPAEAPKPPAKKGPLTRAQKREVVETLSEGLAQGSGTTLGKLPEALLRAVAEELGEPAKAVVDAMLGDTASIEERATFAKATLKRIPSGKPPTDKQVASAEALLEKHKEAGTSLESLEDELSDLREDPPDRSHEDYAAHEKKVKALTAEVKGLQKAVKTVEGGKSWKDSPSPKEIADALVATRAAEVRKDPLLLDLTNPVTNRPKEPLNLEGDAQKEFMDRMGDVTTSTMSEYREMPATERKGHQKGLEGHLKELDQEGAADTEQYHATLAQLRGLQMASALEDGDKAEGVTPAFQTFLQAAEAQGAGVLNKFVKLNVTGAAEGDVSAQMQFRNLLRDTEPQDLKKMVPQDHPAQKALEAMTGGGYEGKKKDIWMKNMDSESMEMLQELAEDMLMDEVLFTDMDLVRSGKTTGEIKKDKGAAKRKGERREKFRPKIKSVLDQLRKKFSEMVDDAKDTDTVSSGDSGKPSTRPTTKKADLVLTYAYDFAPWGVSLSPQNGNPPR